MTELTVKIGRTSSRRKGFGTCARTIFTERKNVTGCQPSRTTFQASLKYVPKRSPNDLKSSSSGLTYITSRKSSPLVLQKDPKTPSGTVPVRAQASCLVARFTLALFGELSRITSGCGGFPRGTLPPPFPPASGKHDVSLFRDLRSFMENILRFEAKRKFA